MTQCTSVVSPSARFDRNPQAVVIENLIVTDPAVVAESYFWARGRRGPAASGEELAAADLSNYVVQALVVGAQAIGTAGGVQQTYDLRSLVAEVGERTAETTHRSAEVTRGAMLKAAEAMEAASTQTRRAIGESADLARKDFTSNVEAAQRTLSTEMQRLVGGDSPELLARLQPLIDRFGRDLQDRSAKQSDELIMKVARQFDPADPTSVLAQQNRMLADQHRTLTEKLTKEQGDLATKVDELRQAVTVAHAARSAAAATAQVTPLKGDTYAESVHRVLIGIAAGLGDDYVDASASTGLVSRSKKGDGVLNVEGGEVRVVFEMTDSQRGSGWGPYLAEAERNRAAQASIGLVRTPEQLRGSTVMALGARRIVLAYDPEHDRPDLLRTVVQLVRLAAVAAQRDHTGEIRTAEEKIQEALATLSKIDTIEKTAGLIAKSASTISGEADALRTEVTRLLKQAGAALAAPRGGEHVAA